MKSRLRDGQEGEDVAAGLEWIRNRPDTRKETWGKNARTGDAAMQI